MVIPPKPPQGNNDNNNNNNINKLDLFTNALFHYLFLKLYFIYYLFCLIGFIYLCISHTFPAAANELRLWKWLPFHSAVPGILAEGVAFNRSCALLSEIP